MKACLTTEEISPEEATRRAVEGEGVIGMDYVREVTTTKPYQWDPEDRLSQAWSIANGEAAHEIHVAAGSVSHSSRTTTELRRTSCAGCAKTDLA